MTVLSLVYTLIVEFDWDDENEEHIARHGVVPEEAEDAVLDPDAKQESTYSRIGERRTVFIGQTQGKILFVVLTIREKLVEGEEKPRAHWRVVTAREATRAEKSRYRRQR